MPILKNYREAEDWLISITDYERLLGRTDVKYNTRTFDLQRFRDQLARLGDPQRLYAVIHVAGTKGKGSTCAMLEANLRACGYRTGLYTSPHLFRFAERIRLNGQEIPEADFCEMLHLTGGLLMNGDTQGGADGASEAPARSFRTVFEILTASALTWFARQQVDVAIIETGLGGRLDSTNVFDEPGDYPLINVIASIGFDHTAILGETIEAIAGEKAGIVRPHARVVVARQPDSDRETTVRGVMEQRLADIGARHRAMYVADAVHVSTESSAGRDGSPSRPSGDTPNVATESSTAENDGVTFTLKRPLDDEAQGTLAEALSRGLTTGLALPGEHQHHNAATVLTALTALEAALAAGEGGGQAPSGGPWPALRAEQVAAGLQNTHWPGRFTVIDGAAVPIVIDGAHCPLSTAALARTCKQRFGQRPAVLITGFLRDKAGGEMLRVMARELPVALAIPMPPDSPRAVPEAYIREALVAVFGEGKTEQADSPAEALKLAVERASVIGGYVVVFGSLYLIGSMITEAGSLTTKQ